MKSKLLKHYGEHRLIERLCRLLPDNDSVIIGPGDDCAIVRASGCQGYDFLLASDPVIEGVHFTRQTPAAAIGHKGLGRVLSDFAAMGGEPLWALTNLVAPADTPIKKTEGIFRGLARLANKHGMAVVGGDVSSGNVLELHVFVMGRVRRGQAVLRSGARPGDLIYVTGALGGSLAGRHLKFEPRLKEGQWLARHGWARAMIDVSDGLATDLRHLMKESRLGVKLSLDKLPISRTVRLCGGNIQSWRQHALTDGEDFELLFAVSPEKKDAFQRTWRRAFSLSCSQIGEFTDRSGKIELTNASLEDIVFPAGGYEHFRS